MKKRMKTTRKKGSAIIEFLVVLPVFMMLIWGIMQVMLFTLATSTVNEAAMEGSRVLAQNLRGFEGTFNDDNLAKHNLTKDMVANVLALKVENVTRFNNYVMLFHDGNGNSITPQIKVALSKSECTSYLSQASVQRGICTWSDDTFGDGHEQVGVLVKSKFNVVGSFIPGLGNMVTLNGSGVSHKELTNRFNYY